MYASDKPICAVYPLYAKICYNATMYYNAIICLVDVVKIFACAQALQQW